MHHHHEMITNNEPVAENDWLSRSRRKELRRVAEAAYREIGWPLRLASADGMARWFLGNAAIVVAPSWQRSPIMGCMHEGKWQLRVRPEFTPRARKQDLVASHFLLAWGLGVHLLRRRKPWTLHHRDAEYDYLAICLIYPRENDRRRRKLVVEINRRIRATPLRIPLSARDVRERRVWDALPEPTKDAIVDDLLKARLYHGATSDRFWFHEMGDLGETWRTGKPVWIRKTEAVLQ